MNTKIAKILMAIMALGLLVGCSSGGNADANSTEAKEVNQKYDQEQNDLMNKGM